MSWPISKPSPRTVVGNRLVQRFLEGECSDVHFGRGKAPGGDKHATFEPFAKVWLWLPTDLANPLTGEKGVWAEAQVLGTEPDGRVSIVTERMLLKGAVPADRLKKRQPGEIAPGRFMLCAGRPRTET